MTCQTGPIVRPQLQGIESLSRLSIPLVLTFLAPLNRFAEDVGADQIVTLRNMQAQILLANVMIGSDNAALEDIPEAFNGVRVNCTNEMLADGVAY